MIKKALAILLIASACYADQLGISSFKYLNSNENSTIIDPSEAQDLLNIDITPGGKSFKKRSGYGLYKTVFTPSIGVHGGYHFFDTSGNDVQLWGSSVSLKGIVADGSPNTIVSSATLNSTWDCADTQGSAYCVDSSRDAYIKTNGTTLTNWYTSPLGTMVEATPDRIVVAGISGFPNTLYISGSNAFTNFTVAPLSTDPFQEVIAAPGSKLTHIRWGCQKLLWWKDQSFGYFDFDDQYSASVKIVSDNIGTFDNTSAIDPGGSIWFRGQDGHIYKYDCAALTKETIEITPQIQGSGRRVSNSFTQTSQSDWLLGSSSPTAPANPLNYTVSPGDIYPGSFTVTENGSSGWSSGSASNTSVGTSSISISINNSGDPTNNGFENSLTGNWTEGGTGTLAFVRATTLAPSCGTIIPHDGSFFLDGDPVRNSGFSAAFQLLLASDNSVLASVAIPYQGDCTWRQLSLSNTSNIGKRIKYRFTVTDSVFGTETTTTSDNYLFSGGPITFWYITTPNIGSNFHILLDTVQGGSSTITSGQFTSQALDTGLPYSFVMTSATWSSNTSTPSIVLQGSAASGGPFVDINRSTGTNVQTSKRYLRYISSFTVSGNDNALTALTGVNILCRSSGTYFSQVKNAPNISAWSTFNPTYTNNGDAINFYIRSATGVFQNGVLTSTPSWVDQTPGALVSASSGTYFQVIASFTVTAATNTPSYLSDFTVNWFDGSASDQAYMLYFDNAIWATMPFGVGVSSNNYVFKRDLINDGWGLYNFGAGGMLIQSNRLYFGSVSDGSVYQYASGTSDNGTAITAYWKSKDFTSQDPFVQSSLNQIDVFAKQNTGQSITSTYTIDTSSSTSYTVNLSSSAQTYIQNRKLLPSGKTGYTFNLKLGDTSTTSNWEIFGFRISYTTLPWKPTQ